MSNNRRLCFVGARLFSLLLVLLGFAAGAQVPVQTIRGAVTDAATARPLPGATVILKGNNAPPGTTANEAGNYQLGDVPVGRYQMQVSYVGFETVLIAGILVEAGKEAVQNVPLKEKQEALQQVLVKAVGKGGAALQPLGVHTLTVEEQFRFPATFYDPARLAMSLPGVTGQNDGANIMSIRGNSPAALKWRLEGVEIVNPNHTANAGTFSDRPTSAGGGVNILSAQLLSTSHFLTGAFPAGYGNALGGILDMYFRNGNDHQHEFTAQAGFIGMEVAAEGPLGSRQSLPTGQAGEIRNPKSAGASYLANYRYSFTGLLTAMGADFGHEETSFQDLSFNLALPTENAGKFTLFGAGGKSKTLFRSPGDSALITEDKERFDIDFHSEMGALGMTHLLPIGKKSVWRTAFVVSALEHRRTANLVRAPGLHSRWEDDDARESKTGLSSVFSHKISARHQLKAGIQLSRELGRFDSFFTHKNGAATSEGEVQGWLVQPYLDWSAHLTPKLELGAGLHWGHFTYSARHSSLEPRFFLSYLTGANSRASLAYGLHSQTQAAAIYASPVFKEKGLGFTKSHHLEAGYRQNLAGPLEFNASIYYQHLFDVPVSGIPGSTFSTLNTTEAFHFMPDTLVNSGTGRNYGLDVSLEKFILDRYYFLLAGSLYRSLFKAADGVERPTRFDGRYLLNLTAGREFSKQRKGKAVRKGVNAHFNWFGGYRGTPIDVAASQTLDYTVFQENQAFSLKQPDYYRLDFRFYLKWDKAGRNSTLSLDIQNATNRKNVAYDYFDTVKGKIVTKKQLGLIPILSYRVGF